MDWRAMIRNPWLVGGVAVAAGVGLVVAFRRRGGAGLEAPAPNQVGYSGGPGGIDTTGTDIAGWLGQYQAAFQSELDTFRADIQAQVDALSQLANRGAPEPMPRWPRRRPSPRTSLPRRRTGLGASSSTSSPAPLPLRRPVGSASPALGSTSS